MKSLPKITIGQKPTFIKVAEDVDFFSLFQKIEREFDTCFLYESLGEEGKFDRYSVIGFSPIHVISARENVLTIDTTDYPTQNPYEALRSIMPEKTITREYAGGLVGYLSYEAVNYFEESIHVKIHDKFDQFVFGVYTDGLIYDKLTNELQYFYYEENRLPVIKKILNTKIKNDTVQVHSLGNSVTKEEHAVIAARVKELIASGNIFQCEVGFKTEYEIQGNALQIYKQLRKLNPSPFMYFLKFAEKKIVGASPELLFSLRDGEATTKPLAGTIARGKDEKEDQKLAKALLNNPKEIAEHMMLVDLHRNDIGRIAQFGTVKIKELLGIKKFSHVQHISSEIGGIINHNEDMFSGLAANFPTGTLSGAPKIEAMKIIDANEKNARGSLRRGCRTLRF